MAVVASERVFRVIPIFPCLDSNGFWDKCASFACVSSVQAMTDVKLFDLIPLHSGSPLLQRNQSTAGEVLSAFISFHLLFKVNERRIWAPPEDNGGKKFKVISSLA